MNNTDYCKLNYFGDKHSFQLNRFQPIRFFVRDDLKSRENRIARYKFWS